ncbi:MAG: DUF4190 domain-containing protein [Deltaproteobacteria bacterium]|nr:DUF4190 domain-containing protein [Deltaproteobacteria bacterium]
MRVRCPHCQAILDVSGLAPGSTAACGHCTRQFVVPTPVSTPTAPIATDVGSGAPEGAIDQPRPEAAAPLPYPPSGPRPPMPAKPAPPGAAIASLVLGVASFLLCGIFFSIPGVILGYQARKQIEANPDGVGGADMVKAAIIVNWINIALSIVAIIFMVVMFVFGLFSEMAA